jgi:hypothetical protein
MRIALIVTLSAFVVSGCVMGERITSLKPGMSKEQALKIAGRYDGFQTKGDLEIYRYTNKHISGWSNDKADYVLVFKDGKLVSYGTEEVRQNSSFNTLLVL